MAGAIFRNIVKASDNKDEWLIDSAGLIDLHTGEQPDARGLKVLNSNGIPHFKHTSRLVTSQDFEIFYWILTMDSYTLHLLNQMKPSNFPCKIQLLGHYDVLQPNSMVRDPYFDNEDEGYVKTYAQCMDYCHQLLKQFYSTFPAS